MAPVILEAGALEEMVPNDSRPQRGTWELDDRLRRMSIREFGECCDCTHAHVMESTDPRHLFTVPFELAGQDKIDDEYLVHSKAEKPIAEAIAQYESGPRVYLRFHFTQKRGAGHGTAHERVHLDVDLPAWTRNLNVTQRLSWFWSKSGAVTNFHYDANGNGVLLQVQGRKQILLARPEDTPNMYAFPPGHPFERRSKVFEDMSSPEARAGATQRYPHLALVAFEELVIRPGEWCMIPLGWWHQVKSMDSPTLSLNLRMARYGYEYYSEARSSGA